MTAVETWARLGYLTAAVCFVLGLHLMNSPATAKRGNRLSAAGMALAFVATVVVLSGVRTVTTGGVLALAGGTLVGAGAGLVSARRVAMTAMPQLVSLFNAAGGGAAALIAVSDITTSPIAAAVSVAVGTVTFSGSLIASGKLQGVVTGQPLVFPGARVLTVLLATVLVVSGGVLATGHGGVPVLIVTGVAGLAFGVTMVLPIGGADMPVVISLLNALTGTAVAMAGFVIGNSALVIAGALVGASGTILTKLMADAMNRPVRHILIGGFGTDSAVAAVGAGGPGAVRELSIEDAAIQLAYARKVVIVPGYGLAAAQAQHAVRELASLLTARGVEVTYAIHPVAGRMPGHMNVLLAEADVPYDEMEDLEEANPGFARADVALVVGANDVTNPAARRPGNAVSGMPILDVDRAERVIVVKRSMGHGYAGIDNELYYDSRTGMVFADAKSGLMAMTSAVKTLVA